MQQQKTKSRNDEAVEEVIEEKVDTTRSQQVSEDAECCLADIDCILEEHENRELTDQEILDQGRPGPTEEQYAEMDKLLYAVDNAGTQEEYQQAWDAYDKRRNEIFEGLRPADERFRKAYFNVHGVEYNSCVCG